MERRRISNSLIPQTSERFTMTSFDKSKIENTGGKQEHWVTNLSWHIPEGIIDFWRPNSSYTSLLLSMKIDENSNEEASYIIREAVATSRNYTQEHLEASIEKDKDNVSIVYTWRTKKLPLSTITHKHRQLSAKVLKVIKMYKGMVRQ